MALDKQRILSELGSVVNQLQSAECGCMGQMFSNPNQGSSMGTPMQSYGGCRMGCCHGHGAPFAGEPYSHMNNQCMNRPTMMGNCNPKQLYADTYNYLNKNLMEPVVNEVYNDLKSISPENTVMSNPMASKMGLSPTNPAMGQGNMSGMTHNPMAGGNMTNPNQGGDMGGMSPGYNMGIGNSDASPQMGRQQQYMGQMDQPMGQMGQPMGQTGQPMGQTGQPMGQMGQSMSQMGGMGSQIMKMMMSDKSAKPANMPVQNGQLTDSMLIDAPQSPHGAVGVTPLRQGTYNANAAMHNPNYALGDAGAYAKNSIGQHMSQPNAYTANSLNNNTPQNNIFQNNLQQNNLPLNNMVHNNMTPNSGDVVQNVSGAQPMANRYGQHSQGMKKFSEMFPGVMQGDLGFDPMAIAIQMNPANQQQAAMNAMQKLMNGNKVMNTAGDNSVMQPIINSANGANASIAQSGNTQITQQNGGPTTNQRMPNQQPVQNQLQPVQQQQMRQEIDLNAAVPNNQVPPQQIYTASSPGHYQQAPTQQYQQQPQQYQPQAQLQQQLIDPNTGGVIDSSALAGGNEQNPNAQMQQSAPYTEAAHLKEMIMEPIFPADTSKNSTYPTYSHQVKHTKNYYYNTLGQPIHLLDAKAYRPVEPPLPQTLSPQPIKPRSNPQTFSNVKNTVSKTSIMGNGPVGRTPSKNQLQHLYNQYKGSHSFTQQNVNAPVQYQTHSEGKLNENVNARERPVPVERFGGDTLANNAVNNQEINKLGQPTAPMGDVVPANKPEGEGATMKMEPMKKGRNGLQDMVYTSSPTTTAWSFHGNNYLPYSTGHRFRTRAR